MRGIYWVLLLLAVAPASADDFHSCKFDDAAGICLSLGVHPTYTYITSVNGFTADGNDLVAQHGTNGVAPVQSMFDLLVPPALPFTKGKWVAQLQKGDGTTYTWAETVCGGSDGSVRIRRAGTSAGPTSSDVWGTVYKQTDVSAVDAKIVYADGADCPDVGTLLSSGSVLKCAGANCRIVFSSKPAAEIHIESADDSLMPMTGGSVEFRSLIRFAFSKDKKQMIIDPNDGHRAISVYIREIPQLYFPTRDLQGKDWTLTILPQNVKLKGQKKGSKIIFEGDKPLGPLDVPTAFGKGASYDSASPITGITLQIGKCCPVPFVFTDEMTLLLRYKK